MDLLKIRCHDFFNCFTFITSNKCQIWIGKLYVYPGTMDGPLFISKIACVNVAVYSCAHGQVSNYLPGLLYWPVSPPSPPLNWLYLKCGRNCSDEGELRYFIWFGELLNLSSRVHTRCYSPFYSRKPGLWLSCFPDLGPGTSFLYWCCIMSPSKSHTHLLVVKKLCSSPPVRASNSEGWTVISGWKGKGETPGASQLCHKMVGWSYQNGGRERNAEWVQIIQ